MPDAALKTLPLADARHVIRSGDLLLFRAPGLTAEGIRFVGRGRYSHAAKASWQTDDWGQRSLWCLESRELKGCRAVTLESQVRRYPLAIDVFRANAIALPECQPESGTALGPGQWYDRQGADRLARELTARPYGYRQILRTAAIHSPILWLAKFAAGRLRWLAPAVRYLARLTPDVTNDALANGGQVYCSAYCAVVDRLGGGCDPVPDLADSYTEPSDLARSIFYRGVDGAGYLGTLVL